MKKSGKRNVLLLSKSGELIETLERALIRGYETQVMDRKGDFLDHAKAHRPDICIVDLDFPNINHYKLIRDLRTLHPAAGHIALFKKGQRKLSDQALKSGADACTSYLIQAGEFKLIVTKVLNSASARRVDADSCLIPSAPPGLLQHIIDNSP